MEALFFFLSQTAHRTNLLVTLLVKCWLMKVVFVYLKNNDTFVNSNVHYDDTIYFEESRILIQKTEYNQ